MICPVLFCFSSKTVFAILWFLINFRIISSSSIKQCMGILIGIALNPYIALGSVYILALILLIQEYGISSNLFESSLILYCFQNINCSRPWLSLYLGLFFFVMWFLNGFFSSAFSLWSLLVYRKATCFHLLNM